MDIYPCWQVEVLRWQVEVLALAEVIFATTPNITWSAVGGKGKGRAMSDRDMRSEVRTFWIMSLPAQPLNGRPTRVERGCILCEAQAVDMHLFLFAASEKLSRAFSKFEIVRMEPSNWEACEKCGALQSGR